MFSTLLRHEWRILARDRAFRVLAALLLGLIGAAAWTGRAWVGQQRATLAAIEEHDARLYERLAEQVHRLEARGQPPEGRPVAGMAWYLLDATGDPAPAPHLDPRRPEAAGSEWVAARHAVLPPHPFAALAIGQGDLYPYYARVTIRTRPAMINSDEIENPVTLLSGRFDLAFVLVFCWPLIALPLLYDLLSRDRDDQTLPLVLAQPVSLRAILFAKALVRGGTLTGLTLVATLGALAAVGAIADGPTLARAGMLATGILAHAVLWVGVAVAINAAGWRSARNAMAFAGIWLAWVFAIPAVLNIAVSSLASVPSRVELITAMREATNAAGGDVGRLVAHYYEEHPELVPPETTPERNAVRSIALQEAAERRVEPLVRAFAARIRDQRVMATRLAWLSPAILLQGALNELAGTSTARYEHFASQLEAYHAAWRAFFYPRIYARQTLTADDYARLPRFTYHGEPSARVVARAGVNLGAIAAAGAALFALGMRALRRYPAAVI
jgi:ABC-2 type transport system permease protein